MAGKFDAEKAVQVAAMLAELNGGSVDRYALIKMMYDVDRIACEKWGESITGDQPVSMEHGPVLSRICDLTKGTTGADAVLWNEVFENADEDHVVTIRKQISEKDRLSKSDIKIISEVFKKLGKMNFAQLKKWSHALGEYEHVPKGESRSILEGNRLKAVGKSQNEINRVMQETAEDNILKLVFAAK